MEFRHTLGRPLTDGEILALLRAKHPDKVFSIGQCGEIVESYRDQPTLVPTRAELLRNDEVLREMREAMVGYVAVSQVL